MNLDLFEPEAQDNLLPYDGVVKDFGLILDHEQSQKYLNYFLQHLAWQHDEVYLHGRYYKTERKVVWYGDDDYQYHYIDSNSISSNSQGKLIIPVWQIYMKMAHKAWVGIVMMSHHWKRPTTMW